MKGVDERREGEERKREFYQILLERKLAHLDPTYCSCQ
jgi:hypothetical protein